jgi:hypothetical protein
MATVALYILGSLIIAVCLIAGIAYFALHNAAYPLDREMTPELAAKVRKEFGIPEPH